MTDEKYTFGTARVRLEEIASEVRKKDTSLEKSLDLLEEGVRLANICTELVDHTDMSTPQSVDPSAPAPDAQGEAQAADEAPVSSVVEPAPAEGESTDVEGADEDYDDEDEPSDAASVE